MTRSSPSTRARALGAPALALGLALVLLLAARTAAAQACCAGSGAVTPARLGVHEDALLGVQLRLAHHLGSHDVDGRYLPTPAHARELNFEQNLFGAVRVARRGQLALLVPIVETHRRSYARSSTGGGIGDVNLAARYDVVRARESLLVPGIGLLAGITLPTGRTAESAERPLATDATGIGAVQANGGLALEQTFGPWFAGVSALFAWRAPRMVGNTRMTLAPQYTLLVSGGHAFESGATAAVVLSYAVEGRATANGEAVPQSARRITSVSLAAAYPLSDRARIVCSLFANPPLSSFGLNQPVTVGGTLGLIWGFS